MENLFFNPNGMISPGGTPEDQSPLEVGRSLDSRVLQREDVLER